MLKHSHVACRMSHVINKNKLKTIWNEIIPVSPLDQVFQLIFFDLVCLYTFAFETVFLVLFAANLYERRTFIFLLEFSIWMVQLNNFEYSPEKTALLIIPRLGFPRFEWAHGNWPGGNGNTCGPPANIDYKIKMVEWDSRMRCTKNRCCSGISNSLSSNNIPAPTYGFRQWASKECRCGWLKVWCRNGGVGRLANGFAINCCCCNCCLSLGCDRLFSYKSAETM